MKNLLSLIGAGLVGGLIVVGAMQLASKKVNVAPQTNLAKFASDNTTFLGAIDLRSEEHTSELQSRTVIWYAVFC